MRVEDWLKRHSRKVFYLYKTEMRDGYSKVFTYYHLIWVDGDKVKYGTASDGMYTRYGINTVGWIKGDVIWSQNPTYAPMNLGLIEEMKKVREGTTTLPEFRLDTLKDLRN